MKRLISSILAFLLTLSLIPTVFAVENHFSKVQEYKDGQFSDVSESDWYATNVKTVYEYGIMQGSGDIFGVKNSLSIAEAITMAARLHSRYHTGTDSFTQGNPWYQVYVDYALENNIISGTYPDYGQAATRTAFVTILRNALPAEALPPINTVDENMIPDVSMNAQGASEIYDFYRAGILTGSDTSGTFQPQSTIDRASVSAIVSRMVEPSLRQKITLQAPKVTIFAADSNDTLLVPVTMVENYVDQGWSTVPHEFSLDGYFQEYDLDAFAAESKGVFQSLGSSTQTTWEYGAGCLIVGDRGKLLQSCYSWENEIDITRITEIYFKRGIDELDATYRNLWDFTSNSLISSFGEYTALSHVELPDTMRSLHEGTFGSEYDACKLTRIGIPSNIEYIYTHALGDYDFEHAKYDYETREYIGEDKYTLKNQNLVIYCVPGSAASEFAEKYHVRQVAATQVFHPDGRTCMVSASEKSGYLAKGWLESPATLAYNAEGMVKAIPIDETEAYEKQGWYSSTKDFTVVYNRESGEAKVVGKNEKSSFGWPDWSDRLEDAITTIYADDGHTLKVLKGSVDTYAKAGWHNNEADAKITMYALDGRTLSVWKANVEEYKKVGWYTQPMTLMYSADGRTLAVATSEVPAYEKVGWFKSRNSAYSTMYALDGRTIEVPNSKIAENQKVGWYLYPDYVSAKADATVKSSGYADAVNYIEEIMKNSSGQSYYNDLLNKRNGLCAAWQKEIGCPIAILGSSIGHNSLNIPTVHITYRNLTSSTLNAFELKFTCVDVYGKVTTDWPMLYDGTFTGYSDTAYVAPYSTGGATWTLNSNERTTSIRNLHILRAVFSDGTIWKK